MGRVRRRAQAKVGCPRSRHISRNITRIIVIRSHQLKVETFPRASHDALVTTDFKLVTATSVNIRFLC